MSQSEKPSQKKESVDTGIHTNFKDDMTYGDYLGLDHILSSQKRLSEHHDEMLFIVIHQTSELWMKLILHELEAATKSIAGGELEPAFKMLARVSRVQEQLIQSWDVLSTLTPTEYMEFRDHLGHSSGFQSWQNRLIEFSLGHKNERALLVYQHQPELYHRMEKALHQPSLYDVSIQQLANRGLPIDTNRLQRDFSQDTIADASVEAAWLTVYRNVDQYWDLYELAEKLVDVEDRQQRWRYNHLKTVERIIGYKTGTGGSSGVTYLKRVLDHRFFPELWNLRTQL
ncbi:tryptophan 2,3-dioxygenase [Marininema halotolerans]|uniref:Tryptophan 2,3-dioxygenase n=1 Tax=Marininema halotolerans TaxID=1155944 RepID=A0A1I6QP32_9BACL|nr:tryptophan 2,3-dioxygenase [Marininema halotolerans]SFS54231.1 tryptophan 2,3-dioxygenase [Marininema halotolerans]